LRRVRTTPRPGWLATVEEQGLGYAMSEDPATGAPTPYWDESAYYEFSLPEVEALEDVVAELHDMCRAAADHVVTAGTFAEYGVTDPLVANLIRESWWRRAELPSVYGRFDLRYDGDGPVKLLEYNADTPTSLIEAASPQWFWMEERFPGGDQWNSLHERLVEAWRRQRGLLPDGPVHFAYSVDDPECEDFITTAYLAECAEQAGIATAVLPIEEIGWDPGGRRFVGTGDETIRAIFKLYPWEWLVGDRFGAHLLELGADGPLWIEPAWKMLWSNKALLATLWELFPGHPNLLPAYLDGPRELAATGYVRKALHGREGNGITIVTPGGEVSGTVVPGGPEYGAEGHCFQAFYPLPDVDGNRPVFGAWVVDGEPAGLGIRESAGLITDRAARFLPHVIR
jgi:glutathionylspermidine synthase